MISDLSDDATVEIRNRWPSLDTSNPTAACMAARASGLIANKGTGEPAYGSDEIWKAEKRNLDLRLNLAPKDSAGPVTSKTPPSTGDERAPSAVSCLLQAQRCAPFLASVRVVKWRFPTVPVFAIPVERPPRSTNCAAPDERVRQALNNRRVPAVKLIWAFYYLYASGIAG